MALTINVNSYVTLDEANAYFATRADSDKWFALDNNAKEDAIVTATNYLDDTSEYVGVAVSTSQALAWPRSGTYYEPKFGQQIDLDETVAPDRVKRAVYEMALHLVENPCVLSTTATMDGVQVGSMMLTDYKEPSRKPHMVRKVIAPLLQSSGNGLWRAW